MEEKITYTCKHCKRDLTKLIELIPQDGNEYTITCPQCKVEIKVRRT